MDKFVVKTRREDVQKPTRSQPKKRLKQAKIDDLKTVVSIERLTDAARALKQPNQNVSVIMQHLNYLNTKCPSIELLQSTKIGRSVKKLCLHENSDVSSLAQRIVQCWSSRIEHISTRQSIEVQLNAKTRAMRDKARSMLMRTWNEETDNAGESTSHSCSTSTPHTVYDDNTTTIERVVFENVCQKKAASFYRQSIRKLTLKLKYDATLRGWLCAKQTDCDLEAWINAVVGAQR